MATLRLVVVVFLLIGVSVASYIQPTVTLNSCLDLTADFTITNMSAGGLIYIRSYSAFNVLPSIDGTMHYACPFEDCGLNMNVKFRLVIQRKVLYQTSSDVTLTYICMGDVQPVLTISSASGETVDENVTTVVVKPEVAMTFYEAGSELPGGNTIKLGTTVDVTIEVTNNFEDFFDISVMLCFMSSVPLFENFCPLHPDVFGLFTKVTNGNLTNAFYMFKPTTTEGGDLEVIISCVLKVCMGACDWVCNPGSGARRRRDSEEKTLADGREVDDNNVYVGKMFTVTGDQIENNLQPDEGPCLHVATAAVMLGFLGILFVVSLSFCVHFSFKFIRYSSSEAKNKSENKETAVNSVTCNSQQDNENGVLGENNSSVGEDKQQEGKETPATPTTEEKNQTTATASGDDNQGFIHDRDTQEPVLYTNRERRRSSKIEIPLVYLQHLISKVSPDSRLARKVIVYKGIKNTDATIRAQSSEDDQEHRTTIRARSSEDDQEHRATIRARSSADDQELRATIRVRSPVDGQEHRATIRARSSEDDQEHRATIRALPPGDYQEHRASIKARSSVDDQEHRATIRARSSEDDQEHRATIRALPPGDYQKHRASIKARSSVDDQEHRATIRARPSVDDQEHRATIRTRSPENDQERHMSTVSRKRDKTMYSRTSLKRPVNEEALTSP